MSKQMSPEAESEKRHFLRVMNALASYKRDSKERLAKTQDYIKSLPLEHQRLLTKHSYLSHLNQLESCIELNHKIISEILVDAGSIFENDNIENNGEPRKKTSMADIEKVHDTIKVIVRDWSDAGAKERSESYVPIINELNSIYDGRPKQKIKVLVPGAGLGRLAWEIAQCGYECQGNEFSVYMLLASHFVLNKCKSKNCFTIYPWIHQSTNNRLAEDVVRPVTFPDVNPNDLPNSANFSMAAGDFSEVYRAEDYSNHFDCIVTCFFIDCARNIIDFVQVIHKILKPGGKWINLGPLGYHFAGIARENSIEPSYDVLRGTINGSGFRFDREETNQRATFCQNPKSMLKFEYKCCFFTCTKI